MPPGPVFNWLAVAHSALAILDHALQFRAAQVARVGGIRASQSRQRARGSGGGIYESEKEAKDVVEELVTRIADESSSGLTFVQPSSLLHANDAWLRQLEIAATPQLSLSETVSELQLREDTTGASTLLEPNTLIPTTAEARPPAAELPMLAIDDVNLSRPDGPLSQHPPIPESDASPDVRTPLNRHLNLL